MTGECAPIGEPGTGPVNTANRFDLDDIPAHRATPHAIYSLIALTLAYALAYVDRSIVSILLPAIKRAFGVSDAALAFLSGMAFAISFIIVGLPLASWSDRGNRRDVIALSVAVWSLMTALCGLAATFPLLVLGRIGVGVGEGGLTPAAQSMIADLFHKKIRGFALSIYQCGVYLGVLAGLILGGTLAQRFGWRGALIAVGAPGVVLAAIVQGTLREPVRGYFDGRAVDSGAKVGLFDVMALAWRTAAIRYVVIGISLGAMVGQTLSVWLPSFLTRSHHLPVGKVGVLLGFASGIGGALGAVLGGRLSDLFGARDERWRLWVATVALLIAPLSIVSVLFVQNLALVFAMALISAALGAAHLAPTYVVIQDLMPLHMRARLLALIIFVLNLLGLGLGPLIVGALSDHLRPIFGADSLRYALTPVVAFALLAAGAYFAAGRALGTRAAGMTP